jgi:hypothetical protein
MQLFMRMHVISDSHPELVLATEPRAVVFGSIGGQRRVSGAAARLPQAAQFVDVELAGSRAA